MNDKKVEQSTVTNPFSEMYQQEIRNIVPQICIYVIGAVEPWEMGGKKGVSGFIQVLKPQGTDGKALQIMRIKVPEERYGMIDELNKTSQFKLVNIQIEIKESFDKVQHIFTLDQPNLTHLK